MSRKMQIRMLNCNAPPVSVISMNIEMGIPYVPKIVCDRQRFNNGLFILCFFMNCLQIVDS